MPISPDYQHVADAAREDLLAAARKGSKGEPALRRIPVPDDDNAPFIPRGSVLGIGPASADTLRPGTFVLVRRGPHMLIRRLIRTTQGRTAPVLHLATYGGRMDDPLPGMNLVGEVVQVRTNQTAFDPSRESGLTALRNLLTDFNTCTPLARLARMLGRAS